MSLKDLLGDRLDIPVFEGTIAANPTATSVPNVEIDREFRNGLSPSATGMNQLNEAANGAVLYRTKEYFSHPGALLVVPATSFGAGDRARFRFAFRTGAYAHAMGAAVILAPQTSGFDQPARVRLDIATSATGSPAVLSREFVYGASGGIDTHLNNFKTEFATIDGLVPNTDYYATFYDVDYGRLVSACAFELASLTENGGYLAQNFCVGTPILAIHRRRVIEQMRAAWTTGAAKLFNWTVDVNPRATASATARNVFDDASTTVSASTPGYTLDLRHRARASQSTGVPCVMKAFGHKEIGGSVSGSVVLKDSAGATVASITGWDPTPQWRSVAFTLPATQAKYDLQFSNGGSGTLSLYAVSCWQEG